MKPLIYLQTQRWNPLSMSIRFATRSVLADGSVGPSHAGFIGEAGFYLSAQGNGVRCRPRDPDAIIWLLDAPKVEEAYKWALTQVGKPYDFSALFGFALDRNWRDKKRWFCSELVAAAFEQAGAPLLNPETPLYRITPRDIFLSPFVRLINGP